MSLVASMFKTVQDNPFAFLNREMNEGSSSSFTGTMPNKMTNGIYTAELKNNKFTISKNDEVYIDLPINSIKMDENNLTINSTITAKSFYGTILNICSTFFGFDNNTCQLTSYGDVVVIDKSYNSQINWSFAMYYLYKNKLIDIDGDYSSTSTIVNIGLTNLKNKDNFTSGLSFLKNEGMYRNGYACQNTGAGIKFIGNDVIGFFSDNNINKYKQIWSLNTMFGISPAKNATFLVFSSDKLYLSSSSSGPSLFTIGTFTGGAKLTVNVNGDILVSDSSGKTIWSLYVAACQYKQKIEEKVDTSVTGLYTKKLINAYNTYDTYKDIYVKAKNIKVKFDSQTGTDRTLPLATDLFKNLKENNDLKNLYEYLGQKYTTDDENKIKNKNKTKVFTNKIQNPSKFLNSNPSISDATAQGKILEDLTKITQKDLDNLNTLIKNFMIFTNTTNKYIYLDSNKSKSKSLYITSALYDNKDVTGLFSYYVGNDVTNIDNLKTFSNWSWVDLLELNTTYTLYIEYKLNNNPTIFKEDVKKNETINFARKIDCKVDWGPCIDGTQKYTIISEKLNGNDCPTYNSTTSRACVNTSVDCVGAWGTWGACDSGTQVKRYIIKTPAAYGGAECLSNDMPTIMTQDCIEDKDEDKTKSAPEGKEGPLTFWEQYKWWIIGGGSVLLILIIVMMMMRKPKL